MADDNPYVDDHGLDDGDPTLDHKYVGLFRAVVLDNKDPDNLGRVKFTVDGLVEESDWAWPTGWGGAGGKLKGGFWPPPIDAEVVVWFEEGDIDSPAYFSFHYGEGEINSVFGYNSNGEFGQGFESGAWLFEIDDRNGQRKVKVTHKESGQSVLIEESGSGVRFVADVAAGILGSTSAIQSVALGTNLQQWLNTVHGMLNSLISSYNVNPGGAVPPLPSPPDIQSKKWKAE